jgi:hypothetical protein
MFEPIISEETVYFVKFDCGYYAAKQPHYDWSLQIILLWRKNIKP